MKLLLFFTTRALSIFSIIFIVFSLVRTKFFKHLKKNSTAQREFRISLFYAYILTMSIFLFMPNSYIVGSSSETYFDMAGNFKNLIEHSKVNLIPFRTIKNYILYAGITHTIINILGNIFLFVPFGYLLPKIYSQFKKCSSLIIFMSICIMSIEIIQLTVGRTCDIDDFILNFIGGMIGYLICLIDHR